DLNARWRHCESADEVAGAFVNAFVRVARQVVTIQAAATRAFEPDPFDGDDGRSRSEKPFAVAGGGAWTGIKGDAGTIARHEIGTETLGINRPHHRVGREC